MPLKIVALGNAVLNVALHASLTRDREGPTRLSHSHLSRSQTYIVYRHVKHNKCVLPWLSCPLPRLDRTE